MICDSAISVLLHVAVIILPAPIISSKPQIIIDKMVLEQAKSSVLCSKAHNHKAPVYLWLGRRTSEGTADKLISTRITPDVL